MESPKKLYLPRFYGLKNFGVPETDKIEDGEDINVKFNGDLRSEQKPIEEIYIKNAHERVEDYFNKMWWWKNSPCITYI